MTALPPDLEALMPEPAYRITSKMGEFICLRSKSYDNKKGDKLFSEDQVRAVMLAVTERAAKVVESGAPPRKLEGGRVEIGESARNAFAAAIRGDGGGQ